MNLKKKRIIRDIIKAVWSLLWIWLYFPHLTVYAFCKQHDEINGDLAKLRHQIKLSSNLPNWLELLIFLHNNSYYRSLFYYRVGPFAAMLISWWRPSNKYFLIPYSVKHIGKGMWFAHPYSTVLNAESIGDDFNCLHCTTIGTKDGMNGKAGDKPIIGNNVSIGCNVCIIGGIKIGNNVTIGAGSVVIKDVPDNCIVAGNPAKIIKTITSE